MCPRGWQTLCLSAYPARSIEAAVGVETNTGHHWRLVLTDLALLGVAWPGVGTLDDIEALYSADGPANIRHATTKEEVEEVARAARGVKAQVDTEGVRLRCTRAWTKTSSGGGFAPCTWTPTN